MIRDPYEALVFLAKRESTSKHFHPRFMFVAALYAAGAQHISVEPESRSERSRGIAIHLTANRESTSAIEREIEHALREGIIRANVHQRGNKVEVSWS